jgi:glycosyltransferase involved in cell wall biosynthesis
MNDNKRKFRVLMIHNNPTPPRSESRKNLEYHLSPFCEGDLLSRHWGSRDRFRGQSFADIYNMLGSFEYHPTFDSHLSGVLRFFSNLLFYVSKGLRLSWRKGKYDLIVAYGPYTCLMAALIIRILTGSKVVVMLPAPPIETFRLVPGWFARLKYSVASWIVPAMIRRASGVWAYYPTQLDPLPGGGYPPMFVFPEFVPVSTIAEQSKPVDNPTPRYIYFLGFPFERKGVDLLIKAFNQIADKHPDVTLKIVGFCPDLTPYRKLAHESPRVEFHPGTSHQAAMDLMDRCTVFVLPSRLEGVPRVIMEAMACKRPVVASRIHGIPTLIEHEKTGLLIDPEDVDGLAMCLDRILSDSSLARRLAEAGHERIVHGYSEMRYVEFFRTMASALTNRPGPDEPPATDSPRACHARFAELTT